MKTSKGQKIWYFKSTNYRNLKQLCQLNSSKLKEAQIEMKKQENRLSEENLKVLKLETKLEDFKGKSAEKLANVNEK